jgi:dUTP pyrophosphatase
VIILERLHDDAELPSRATTGSAGYDLRAYLVGRTVTCSDGQEQWQVVVTPVDGRWTLRLDPGVMALAPLGFRARIPDGFEAQIRPRSGAAFKKGLRIPNAPGTIDSDSPDEWMVILQNGSSRPIDIVHGERIAQMVLARYEVLPIECGAVRAFSERSGGFGSTGS